MAEYHERMRDWPEKQTTLYCMVGGCEWAITTSGIDTKGDVHDAYSTHLSRHDGVLAREMDEFLRKL